VGFGPGSLRSRRPQDVLAHPRVIERQDKQQYSRPVLEVKKGCG
jgi:hypothetical protein